MSQASEDTVYVCCECVPEPDLGVALHMMPCEKHGRGWHRIVKREVRSVQEPSPAALIVKGQRVQECGPLSVYPPAEYKDRASASEQNDPQPHSGTAFRLQSYAHFDPEASTADALSRGVPRFP
jgi:hypothetical protein